MVTNCCVCGVERGSSQDFNFSFHSFPKNEDLKVKWWEAIGKKVHHSHICSKHFKSEDFKNYDDLTLIRKILKPLAVPSINIKLIKKLEPIQNSSFDTKYTSTETKNEEKSCNNRLLVDESSIFTEIDNSLNKETLNNEATLHSTVNQVKERKISNNTLKSLKKQRFQNSILGIMRKEDFINENAWLRFQKCINKIQRQYKTLSRKNENLCNEISIFKELLKKQLSDDISEGV